jgi:hypothetical protein
MEGYDDFFDALYPLGIGAVTSADRHHVGDLPRPELVESIPNGLYDAKFDAQCVLAIMGDMFRNLIGTHYQQAIDFDRVFSDVASLSERVMSPTHVCNLVDQAIKTALSKRTVSHITIPKDIQDWPSEGRQWVPFFAAALLVAMLVIMVSMIPGFRESTDEFVKPGTERTRNVMRMEGFLWVLDTPFAVPIVLYHS